MTDTTEEDIIAMFTYLREGVEPHHIEAGKAAFAWRTIDEELFELSSTEMSGVRSTATLTLTGRLDDTQIDVDVRPAGGLSEVTVSVEPPVDGTVEVIAPEGDSDTFPLDDGLAIAGAIDRRLVRLRVSFSGKAWLSNWLTL